MTTGIHDAILEHLQVTLQAALIDNIDPADVAIAGVVKIGPLQGEPEPDDARVSVCIYSNDPLDDENNEDWDDSVYDTECGGAITWSRKFTLRIRCLLERTREELAPAREIASTVRERAEVALLNDQFTGISSGTEYVSRGPISDGITIKTRQSGGPPDAFDFHIKIRFDVLTTRTGVY